MRSTAPDRRPIPRIDPRIRARRIAVRRTEGRRRLHWLGAVGLVAAVLAAAGGAAMSPLLDVDGIVLEGVVRAQRDVVLEATGIERGDPLLTLDLAAAEAGVRAVPWVAEASVERAWPGGVEVAIVEREPVAGLFTSDGRLALVDADAQVLEIVPPAGSGVVGIAGLPDGHAPGDVVGAPGPAAIALAGAIPVELRGRVLRVVVSGAGELSLDLVVDEGEPPAEVRFGDGTQLAEKLRALVTMVSSADLSGVDVLDLEVPGAPALTRR